MHQGKNPSKGQWPDHQWLPLVTLASERGGGLPMAYSSLWGSSRANSRSPLTDLFLTETQASSPPSARTSDLSFFLFLFILMWRGHLKRDLALSNWPLMLRTKSWFFWGGKWRSTGKRGVGPNGGRWMRSILAEAQQLWTTGPHK